MKGMYIIMVKIGFYDYYLDEWHANNYPTMLREEISKRNINMELVYAYADIDKPGGLTNSQWCEINNCHFCRSVEELVSLSDAIVILGPSFPQEHERMCKLPLSSGKPVYVDKIFAPDLETGIRIFNHAANHGTPMFSTSALRFADELNDFRIGNNSDVKWCATMGPNSFSVYGIHQIEMIQTIMGGCAIRVKAFANEGGRTIIFDYNNSIASMLQLTNLPFQISISNGANCNFRLIQSNFFKNLVNQMIDFFISSLPPVSRNDTLAVISMLDAGNNAVNNPDIWHYCKKNFAHL